MQCNLKQMVLLDAHIKTLKEPITMSASHPLVRDNFQFIKQIIGFAYGFQIKANLMTMRVTAAQKNE